MSKPHAEKERKLTSAWLNTDSILLYFKPKVLGLEKGQKPIVGVEGRLKPVQSTAVRLKEEDEHFRVMESLGQKC